MRLIASASFALLIGLSSGAGLAQTGAPSPGSSNPSAAPSTLPQPGAAQPSPAPSGPLSTPSPASPPSAGSLPRTSEPSVTTPPIPPPASEASSGRRGAQGSAVAPSSRAEELDRKSREIDRKVMRSICTGC